MFRRRHLVDDYREFTRELLLRFDRAQRQHRDEIRAEHAETRERLAAMREEIRAEIREQTRRTDDLIAENRAQRQALLLLIDELRGSGGPATA